jgi:hypothetical protein
MEMLIEIPAWLSSKSLQQCAVNRPRGADHFERGQTETHRLILTNRCPMPRKFGKRG